MRAVLLAAAAVLAAAAPAAAQDPGTDVGGTVPTYLGLELDASGATELRARVTATSGTVVLSAAFQPLDLDPVLAAFRAPVAAEAVTIPLGEDPGKTLLITLSVASP